MNQGISEEASSDENDNGVVIGEGNAFQQNYVFVPPKPPLPIQVAGYDDVDTKPVPLHVFRETSADESEYEDLSDYELMRQPGFRNGVSESGKYYGTRRHWREPVLRLLRPQSDSSYEKHYEKWTLKRKKNPTSMKRPPQRYGPLWYLLTVYGTLFYAAVVLVLYITSADFRAWEDDYRGWLAGIMLLGMLLLSHSIAREWYRWRKRTVLIRHKEGGGLRITYGEPDNLFYGFNGDRNRQVKNVEGSSELTPLISWPNKLVFWGCGDLDVSSKIESGDSPLLQNIPRVRQVHVFASQDMDSA